MPQLDYASIMGAAQNLVPNMREQMFQDRQLAMQESQVDTARQINAAKVAEAAQAQQRQQQFGEAMEYALHSGDPRDMQRVRMLYPEFAKDLKDGFSALDEDQRRTTLTQLGSVRARLAAGDTAGARAIVARRHEADQAAGVADEDTEELLALLDKGDPESIKLAQGTLTYMLAAVDPDKFGETFGKLEPADAKTAVQKEYEWRVDQFGQQDADRWLATQDESLVTVEPGGSVYRKSDFVEPRGGGLASGGGGGIVATPEQEAESAAIADRLGVKDITFTSEGAIGPWIEQRAGLNASSRQRATGVPGTYHADNNARDFPTKTLAENVAEGRRLKALFGSRFDVIYSETDKSGKHNNHVHVEPGPALGKMIRSRGPVRVASKQQYDKLASGTAYIAPDGSHRVKP